MQKIMCVGTPPQQCFSQVVLNMRCAISTLLPIPTLMRAYAQKTFTSTTKKPHTQQLKHAAIGRNSRRASNCKKPTAVETIQLYDCTAQTPPRSTRTGFDTRQTACMAAIRGNMIVLHSETATVGINRFKCLEKTSLHGQ